jgi:hypothetical protein
MGALLPNYKKAVIDEIINNIASNTSQYYAFAAGPVPVTGNTPAITLDDYNTKFKNDWGLLFGKKLQSTDVLPIINYNLWSSGSVYTRYDNTVDLSNTSFYTVVPPLVVGGSYNVYKCIDNANGGPSTIAPSLIQATSFNPGDGYVWRYITSISAVNFSRFSTSTYVPVVPNPTYVSSAYENSGVEVVNVTNGGNGYISYNSGVVQGWINSTVIQISNSAASDANFYSKNGMYFYNTQTATAQLSVVTASNTYNGSKYVTISPAVNLAQITSQTTNYIISPRVIFTSDADPSSAPAGYSVVNTTSNSIHGVVMVNNGTGITWCNVSIVSNTSYGIGASAYAIVPPPGGHGSDPANELNCQGLVAGFYFANSEYSTIPIEIQYNKIGLIKNPYTMYSNAAINARTSANTFNQVLKASISPAKVYAVGDMVTGNTSGATGVVAFSNTSVLYLTGDKYFSSGEYVSNGSVSTQITINTIGDLYQKNIIPIYIQNVTNVQRANNQTESFRLIIQV